MSCYEQWQVRFEEESKLRPRRWADWAEWCLQCFENDSPEDVETYELAHRKRAAASLLDIADWLDRLYDRGSDSSIQPLRYAPAFDWQCNVIRDLEIFKREELNAKEEATA